MKRWIQTAASVALFVTTMSASADFVGEVIGVVDGDTIDVLVEEHPVRVRLAEIDAPEKRQAFGTRAQQALSAMVFRRTVTVRDRGLDWRGTRTVGRVVVDGRDVSRAMVATGWAWVYPKYVEDRSLFDVEREARDAQRGLWVDAEATAPWTWRAARRSMHRQQ